MLFIFDLFQESYYLGIVSECLVKMSLRQTTLRALAVEFDCLLDEGSVHDKCLLHGIVSCILSND